MDVDPLFFKALRLLHSKSMDAAEQIRQLLDDVLMQRQGADTHLITTTTTRPPMAAAKSEHHYVVDPKKAAKLKLSAPSSEMSVKRHASTVQSDTGGATETKRPRMADSPHSTPIPSPLSQRVTSSSTSPASSTTSSSPSSESNTDTEDFAREMGLVCVVCHSLDVASSNQLLECHECQHLYHQQCHDPPVAQGGLSDPRQVWYCDKCSKKLKKQLGKKTPLKDKPPMGLANVFAASDISPTISLPLMTRTSPTGEVASPQKSSGSTVSSGMGSAQQPFRRTEKVSPLVRDNSNNGNGVKGMAGLAALAANLKQGNSAVTTGGSSSSSSSSAASSPGSATGNGTPQSTRSGSFSAGASASSLAGAKLKSAFSALASASAVSGSVHQSSASSSQLQSSSSSAASAFSTLHSKLSKPAVGGSGSPSKQVSPPASRAPSVAPSATGSGTSSSVATGSLLSADKRLQIMKKKAAAKMQEKRRPGTK